MLSTRRLFRDEAFARRGQREPIDGLLRVTAPHEWMILAGVGLVLLGVLAWALFGRVEQSLSSEGILAYRGERYVIASQDRARVIAVLAAVGDSVEAGQPIAKVRSLELERQVLVARALVSALAAQSGDSARVEWPEPDRSEGSDEIIVSPHAGKIVEQNLAPGLVVEAGTTMASILATDGRELEAIMVASPTDAQRIGVNMEAYVQTAGSAAGRAQWLRAEVCEVAADSAPLPAWLANREDAKPDGRLVRLALRETPATPLRDGAPCNLRIVLRRSSLASMLIPSKNR